MAYDEAVADRIRARIDNHPGFRAKEMFGGIAFLIGGNMAVGVSGSDLMVRVGPEAHDEAMARSGARPFDKSHRPARGWITVVPEGFTTDADLEAWIESGVRYAETLPPK